MEWACLSEVSYFSMRSTFLCFRPSTKFSLADSLLSQRSADMLPITVASAASPFTAQNVALICLVSIVVASVVGFVVS